MYICICIYIFKLYMCNIYSCRRHTHSYPIQLEYHPLHDQHFLNHHIIVRFVLSFHHFLPCCHNELTRSTVGLKFKQNRSKLPTPTHPIQMLAETLKRTTTKLRDTATSSFKLQTPFVESFLFTLGKKILCIYSNHSPLALNKTHRSPASLESPGQIPLTFRGDSPLEASVNGSTRKKNTAWLCCAGKVQDLRSLETKALKLQKRLFKRDPYNGWI